ncbi:MAG TPA: cytochrome c [Gemmatimonadaceae bacterium]|nr:cytochrome c [Gemmatimonadaceae bacterium]
MPRTPMAPEVERLVVRYLVTRAGAGAPAAPPAAAAPAMGVGAATPAAPDAPALYARWCAACHGPAGRGDGPNARHLPVRPAAHADSAAMARRSDDALYDAVAAGGYVMNRSPRMPAFGATLSDAEIRALVRHIRALCRCEGPAWSRDGIGAEGAR